MSQIQILSETVSTKIAAGEVIERPASVVKELVENALDAGADNIRVRIEKAGVRLISVTDNGSGMDQDDALLCFELHGTSKIKTDQDLLTIGTYGFRGEAVPSVASVARVTLRTRKRNCPDGTEVEIAGGILRKSTPVGCAAGSEFIVKDLFFNVPARRKFLKTDATEERHIFDVIMNMSLPNPLVGFELVVDGRTVLHSPGLQNPIPRLQAFFGKNFTTDMVSVDYKYDGIRIRGWIARHGIVRNSRREQRFFVNGRAIESITTFQGVRDGYGSLVEKNCYPPVILFIDLNPDQIDVNVHPAKREIRFRHERILSFALAESIRITLQGSDAPAAAIDSGLSLRSIIAGSEVRVTPAPHDISMELFPEKGPTPAVMYTAQKPAPMPVIPIVATIGFPPETKSVSVERETESNEQTDISSSAPNDSASEIEKKSAPYLEPELPPESLDDPRAKLSLSVIGILNSTYILASFAGGLVIIDQHAAHERILFERLLHYNRDKKTDRRQKLLFPIAIELTRGETLLLRRYLEMFDAAGFEIGEIGQTTIMVQSVPLCLPQENLTDRFHILLTHLMEEDGHRGRLVSYDSLARAACKAAVKANDRLSITEADALIRQMGECDMPFSCPHGRPTIIHLSQSELEKRFGRR